MTPAPSSGLVVSPYKLTIQCSKCENVFRLERIEPQVTMPCPMRFCPHCGEAARAYQDADMDFWEALVKAFEIPMDTLKELYSIWHQTKYYSFRLFIDAITDNPDLLDTITD